jgi:hypothetical protein
MPPSRRPSPCCGTIVHSGEEVEHMAGKKNKKAKKGKRNKK